MHALFWQGSRVNENILISEEFLFETLLTLAPGTLENWIHFFSFQNGTNNIQLRSQLSSWCIYRFGVLFLMWRMWHLCSHLHIVHCAFSGHSRVPSGETSRLAVIPADTRAQGISHIPFNDKLWYKNRKTSQGSQMETSLTDGSKGDWCIRMSYSSLFLNYTWNVNCYFESKEGFFVTAAHMSDAAAGTCCHSPWCQHSQPWTSVLVKSFLGELLSYKETEPVGLLFSKRWCHTVTLPGARW